MSYMSPLLSLPGAVPSEGPDEGVAAHYGDLFKEQRALAGGAGLVDLSHRGVLTVSGADRLSWLHLLITQHVSELPPHQATEALVLSANGHIEHGLSLVDDGETVWIHTEPGSQTALLSYLESMKFFYRVETADRTEEYAVVFLPAGSIAAPPEGVVVRETAYGRELFLPRERLREFADSGTYGPAIGSLALEALRIEAHRPRVGLETDHRTIPHEVGLIGPAVHLQKGCYRGQETVAKVLNLGQPPRRLVMLHLDGSQDVPVVPGGEVRLGGAEGKVVGVVTSAALHADLGPIALAVVRRAVPLDAALTVQAPVSEADGGVGPGALWIDASQEPVVVPRDHGARPATAKL